MVSLEELERRLAAVEERLGLEATGVDHSERLGRIDDGMRQIIALLNHLIEQGSPSDTAG